MNTEKLLEYITKPQSLNQDSLEEIQKLEQLFPYSQNIQLLYLFNLSNIQDIRFGEQLQKTASYAADRPLLKKQIEALKTPVIESPEDLDIQEESAVGEKGALEETISSSQAEKVVEDNDDMESSEIIPSSSNAEELTYDKYPEAKPVEDLIAERNKMRSKAELLQIVKNRLAEIERERLKKSTEKNESVDEAPLVNKMDLIDKFIRVEPSISRPDKTAFFDPDVAAQESLFEDGAFVTETLAKIYQDQGNNQKAIEIYQILSLNNPEKSAYFAALIEELENN